MAESIHSVVEPAKSESPGAAFFNRNAGAAFFPTGMIQRQCDACEKEEKTIQRQCDGCAEEEKEKKIQRQPEGEGTPVPDVITGADPAASPAAAPSPAVTADAGTDPGSARPAWTAPYQLPSGDLLQVDPSLFLPKPGLFGAGTPGLPPFPTLPGSSDAQPDWFGLRSTFLNRGIGSLDSRDAGVLQSLWQQNYDLGKRIMPRWPDFVPLHQYLPDFPTWFANTTTSTAADNALKRDHPAPFEQSNDSTGTHTFSGPAIHFKLAVNRPGDAYEREADEMANKVLQRREAKVTLDSSGVQTKCAHCEEEEKDGGKIQREGTSDTTPTVSPALEQDLGAAKGQGMSLSPEVNEEMSAAFGKDFSGVSIHADGKAAEMSEDLNALAFTHGSDVYFNTGKFDPDSSEGKFLLAHELTHVVQQNPDFGKLGSGESLQREPGNGTAVAQPARHKEIDYRKATRENLDSWYQLYKFYNLFAEDKVYPGSDPIGYANRVYELQQKLKDFFGKDKPYKGNTNGILESDIEHLETITLLRAYVSTYMPDANKPDSPENSNPAGLDEKMLKRLSGYEASFDKDEPELQSIYFRTDPQWYFFVNKFRSFNVHQGDRGAYVKGLQSALISLKYDIGNDAKKVPVDGKDKTKTRTEVSGIFGAGTVQAVKNFQQNSGLEGRQVDGIVGAITLRLLDQRIGPPQARDPLAGQGNAFEVDVEVTKDMVVADTASGDPAAASGAGQAGAAGIPKDREGIRKYLLKAVLKKAFNVSDERAETMVGSGWHWTNYKDVSMEDVGRGYYKAIIPREDFEHIMGHLQYGAESSVGLADERAQKSGESLDATATLYELEEKIKKKQDDYNQLVWQEYAYKEKSDWRPESERLADRKKKQDTLDELNNLKAQRDQELARLGLTADSYDTLKKAFIHDFEQYALQTAYMMLLNNEAMANIEYDHYNDVASAAKLKKVIGDINVLYGKADQAFLDGISVIYTGKPGSYASKSDFINQQVRNDISDAMGGGAAKMAARAAAAVEFDRYRSENLKKKSTSNIYFQDYYDKEFDAAKIIQDSSPSYPILAYPRLALQERSGEYVGMTDAVFQQHIQQLIKDANGDEGLLADIAKTRQRLKDNPDMVWDMPAVLTKAQDELGILPDTVSGKVIADTLKDRADTGFWKSIGLGALGLGLGLLALVSGPIGWIALAGSLAFGAYDAYKTYEDITAKREAYDTALDQADALGQENPSYFWFAVSLVSVGLDLGMAVKVVRTVGEGMKYAEKVTAALTEEMAKAEEAMAKAGKTAQEIEQLKSQIRRLQEAVDNVNSLEYIKNVELLRPLKDNPMAMKFMVGALKEPENVKAFVKMSKLVGKGISKEAYEAAIVFYAGMGRKAINELPEVMRLVEVGGLKEGLKSRPDLLKQLLTDTRLQNVLLTTGDPKMLIEEFDLWGKALKEGKSISLVEFLKEAGYETRFVKGKTITEALGKGFSELPMTVLNRQLLQRVEPRLLDALNNKTLSRDLTKAMQSMLESDVIGKTQDLARAEERMRAGLKQVAAAIDQPEDYAALSRLVDSPTAQRALRESASQIIGGQEFFGLLAEINKAKPIPVDVFDDLLKIGPLTDKKSIERLIADDAFRKVLLEEPAALAALKKCASPCFPPTAGAAEVKRLSAVLKGRSPEEIRKINQYIYQNRDTLETAIKNLEADTNKVLKEIKLAVPNIPAPFRGVKNIELILREIENAGVSTEQMNSIMRNYEKLKKATPGEFIQEIRSFLQAGNNAGAQKMGTIISKLETGNRAEFEMAEILMEDSLRFNQVLETDLVQFGNSPTLRKLDHLLENWKMEDFQALRQYRFNDSFVNVIYSISERMADARPEEIIGLMKKVKSGGPKEGLEGLWSIIKGMDKTHVNLAEVEKAIGESEAFAANVAKALADPVKGKAETAKLLWGADVVVEGDKVGDKIKVPARFNPLATDSGSAAIEMILGQKGSKIANLVDPIAASGNIDGAQWSVLRSVIMDSDIATPIKNNIIGKLWEEVNVSALRRSGFTGILQNVEMKAAGATAKVDAVAFKDGKMYFFEFKALGGELRPGQEKVYGALQDAISKGTFNQLFMGNDELRKQLMDQAVKKAYNLIEESKFLKKGGKT